MFDRRAAALLIAVAGFVAVLTTAQSASITWDEAIYMRSARLYMNWLDRLRADPAAALSKPVLTEYWGVAVWQGPGSGRVEDIHPPLVKLASGLAWRLLRSFIGDLAALRVVPAALFALLLAVLFLWVSEVAGVLAGLAATLCLGVLPRFFAYAHLLALDMPLAALTLAATYVYWKTIDRPGLRWAIPFGLLWGCALGSKNGGLLLPLGLVVWTLIYHHTSAHLRRLLAAVVIAVAVFVVTWPWLYYDTLARLAGFAGFAFLGHGELLRQFTYYLGQIYQKPPWHYPLIMTAAVLPAGILLVTVIGLAGVIGQGRDARTGWLWLLSAIAPMLPFLTGLVAAYDGERLFLAAFPFLAALGGLGFARLLAWLWDLLWRRLPRLVARRQNAHVHMLLTIALVIVIFAPPLASIVHLHPYELAYYGETIGGIPGAAWLGLETTFWADSYQGVLDYLNTHTPAQGTVWADAYQVLWTYRDIGRLRQDIVVPGADAEDPGVADLAVVQARQSRYFPPVARLLSQEPALQIAADGVPLVMVYALR